MKYMALRKKIEYNPYLLKAIQPVGGISFSDRAIIKGDGYESCIRIYEFKTRVENFWLEDLTDLSNVIVTVDISTENQNKILDQIERSISEQYTRIDDAATNIDRIKASAEVEKLQGLVDDITQHEEVIKLVTIRYYVSALTLEELDIKVKEVLEAIKNKGYRGAVLINEQEYEWKSLFESATNQSYFRNKRVGEPIPSIYLGGGYPFHFTELSDPTGMYLGTTRTGGNVLFNIFTMNDFRKSYNALVVGLMGAGKSTLLKKLLKNTSIVGDMVRVFDIAGEFRDLVLERGGKVIALDGTDGIINLLQVFATIVDEDTNEVLEEQSYMNHLNKVSMIYRCLAPDAEQAEVREFERILREFYKDYGIEISRATTYKANEYPIMEDLLEYIRKELYEDFEKKIVKRTLSDTKRERLEYIELNIGSMVDDYGKLFNGHSTLENFYDEQIVSFEDSQKFFVLIDEAHKFINSDNLMAVDYAIAFEREARKYFAGLMFATQSIRDVVPENISSEALHKIKTLFELTQYKFIMQQDNNSKEALKEIFDGQITESEIERVPTFKKGECILAINGYKNIKLNIEITDKEKQLFAGGA